MARKNVTDPKRVIEDGDMSGDLTSLETNIQYLDNAYYQLVWTGSPVGTFIFEADIGGTWTAMDPRDADNLPPTAAGVAGSHLINLLTAPGVKIRMRYVATSGSGSLNAYVMAKQTGG